MLSVIEERYLEIVAAVDAEFCRNRSLHGEKIHCRPGCADCCHHIFQITEIEAASISKGIQRLDPRLREGLKTRAREYMQAHRKLVIQHGEPDGFGRLPPTGMRLACPALDQGMCSIYDFRPLMCHKFGMPLYNPDRPDRIFACELNFRDGEEIKDSNLIQIQTGIHQAWKELQSEYRNTGGYCAGKPLTVANAILEDFSRGS